MNNFVIFSNKIPYILFCRFFNNIKIGKFKAAILGLEGQLLSMNFNENNLKKILKLTHLVPIEFKERIITYISIINKTKLVRPNWILNSFKKKKLIKETSFLYENIRVKSKELMKLVISVKYFKKRERKKHIFQDKNIWFHNSISKVMNRTMMVYKLLGANICEKANLSRDENIDYLMLEFSPDKEVFFTVEKKNIIKNIRMIYPSIIIWDVSFFVKWIKNNETITSKNRWYKKYYL